MRVRQQMKVVHLLLSALWSAGAPRCPEQALPMSLVLASPTHLDPEPGDDADEDFG